MDSKGCSTIPCALFDWITFLTQSLPLRSVPTFIELLVGTMLTQSGFVVQSGSVIDLGRHWTTYFKWLQHGKWSWLALARQMARLVAKWFLCETCYLAIDDTLVFRSSTKAPDSKIHHQHAKKTNRPTFVRGQGWVSLAVIVGDDLRHCAIPILSRLIRAIGNTPKLTIAKTLLRATDDIFQNVTLLLDAWFMRATLVLFAVKSGMHVIGQVRKDTAIYEFPSPRPVGKRGRPRTYGDKITQEHIESIKETNTVLWLYGKKQTVRYRSVIAMARFLKGMAVRVVWTCFLDDKGNSSIPRLLIATNTQLTPEAVIIGYARRWSIEPMFGQTKNGWGWKETWQQSRQVLHRWVHILFAAYALLQLLTILGGDLVRQLANFTPWRVNRTVTAGLVRTGLQKVFSHIRVRDWWDPKSQKFMPPNGILLTG
ncbi:MAG: transposase [Magnetococcales bacterium]|nr:transposase [Magnetococcales bacterium]